MQYVHVPVVIVGAGIAGLWTLNRLRQKGVNALLLERNAIGAGQTIASQGIIHGGAKYGLTGKVTNAANSVAQMTQVWAECFEGRGEIDLHTVRFLSNHHCLWSLSALTGGIKSFLSAKLLNSNSHVLKKSELPPVLQNPDFTGSVCELEERVMDVPSLIEALAIPHIDHIWKIDETTDYHFNLHGQLEFILIKAGEKVCKLSADRYIFTAGEGNEGLLSSCVAAPKMQRRPLQMVWARFPEARPDYALFVHCITSGMVPRLTITTHTDAQGRTVWYLGGALAENGIMKSPAEQIQAAKEEINILLPWINLAEVEWGCFMIDRAEPENGGKRPDLPSVIAFQNLLICWPTKLTLTPALVAQILEHLSLPMETKAQALPHWPRPAFAKPLWD